MTVKLDLERLLVLKDKVIKATNFKEPLEYFFTYFAEVPDFIDSGNIVTDAGYLLQLVAGVGETIMKSKVQVTGVLLKEIPAYHFTHGVFLLQGQVSKVIYFSDIEVGILATLKPGSSGEMAFVRFSGARLARNNKVTLH